MVAALGETTGEFALDRTRKRMLGSKQGRAVLNHRPRIKVRAENKLLAHSDY